MRELLTIALFGVFAGAAAPSAACDFDGAGVKAGESKMGREEFLTQAETWLKAMDVNLAELKAKARTGHAVTMEKMNQAIDQLTKKTESAREELRVLKTAPPERWQVLGKRLRVSLDKLCEEFDRAFLQFMSEWARPVAEAALNMPT